MSRLDGERVAALGALHFLHSKKKLGVEKPQETHFLSTKEKVK